MTDIGDFSLKMALLIAVYSALSPLIGVKMKRKEMIISAEQGVLYTFFLMNIAAAALIYAFLTRDFQVEYVANYSSRDLPMFYTLAAFWGGQKGSLLLWGWVLSLFAVIVVLQNRHKNRDLMPYVVAVLMSVLFFFLLLMTFITNPFERLSFIPPDGKGLNPLLQNPGMIFHPTTLYLGYVGFTIPFAFAIAALITGQLGDVWIRSTRRWTLFAWFFLGVGNLFGAQWAYVELGWGGFWMWDPVESASFMPWLTGTAFLHSVMIQEKKNMLKVWNVVLIIVTFSLSIFGTFLTRSGILSSVHTFAESSMGPFFLGFLGIVLIFSLYLLFSRLSLLKSQNELDSFISRESSFLLNNLLFVGSAFAVFWGTVFPLISEAVRGVKISVGTPFFNQVNIPIFLSLLLITGICPLIAWRRASMRNLQRNFLRPAIIALVGGLVFFIAGIRHTYALISFTLSVFVLTTIIFEFYRGTRARRAMTKEGLLQAFISLLWRNKRRYGGYIIHIGVVLIFVGATGTAFNVEKLVNLKKGESTTIKDYSLTFNNISSYPTRNRYVVSANLSLTKNGKNLGFIYPEKRFYRRWEKQPTTEVALRSTLKEDLYVILAEYDEESATFKLIINPLTIWLWIGGSIMALGTIIVMWPDKGEQRRFAARYVKEAVEYEA